MMNTEIKRQIQEFDIRKSWNTCANFPILTILHVLLWHLLFKLHIWLWKMAILYMHSAGKPVGNSSCPAVKMKCSKNTSLCKWNECWAACVRWLLSDRLSFSPAAAAPLLWDCHRRSAWKWHVWRGCRRRWFYFLCGIKWLNLFYRISLLFTELNALLELQRTQNLVEVKGFPSVGNKNNGYHLSPNDSIYAAISICSSQNTTQWVLFLWGKCWRT